MNYEFITLDFYGFKQYSLRNSDIISFRLHRLDGPAYEATDINNEHLNIYCIEGKRIPKEDYQKEVQKYIKEQIFK